MSVTYSLQLVPLSVVDGTLVRSLNSVASPNLEHKVIVGQKAEGMRQCCYRLGGSQPGSDIENYARSRTRRA